MSKKTSTQSDESAVNSSLLRTRSMLTSELDRINSVNSTFNNDKKAIQRVAEDYNSLENISDNARRVLRSLENKEVKENLVLGGATLFYMFCLVYVVWTRFWIPFIL